jgi:hypothetical protein
MMKTLLIITAIIEGATGAALVVSPSLVAVLLLGESLTIAVGMTVARVAGAALVALAITCWQARSDTQSRAARGLVTALLFYNAAAIMILVYAGVGLKLFGIALWPAVLLHTVLAILCIASLQRQS